MILILHKCNISAESTWNFLSEPFAHFTRDHETIFYIAIFLLQNMHCNLSADNNILAIEMSKFDLYRVH